jgi:hypothetical protein
MNWNKGSSSTEYRTGEQVAGYKSRRISKELEIGIRVQEIELGKMNNNEVKRKMNSKVSKRVLIFFDVFFRNPPMPFVASRRAMASLFLLGLLGPHGSHS